jgi:cbb3-type cytochrome oxidase maturation protein
MESLYLLIPMSLIVVAVIVLILYWAVKSGQFEDLEGPGHSILMDDDVSSARGIEKSSPNTSVKQKE